MSVTAQQIVFLRKNKADLNFAGVSATATSGSDYAARALNRNNRSSWVTTGSTDGDGTYWEVDFGESRDVDEILLLGHNFKAYTVKYWNGAAFVDFAQRTSGAVIAETVCATDNSLYRVTSVLTQKIRVAVSSTQVANADKFLYQFIATQRIGQLAGWPEIRVMRHLKNRVAKPTLSGRRNYVEAVGAIQVEASVKEWSSSVDLALIETLFDATESFLVWICGGSEDQFQKTGALKGYRKEDIFLGRLANDYEPVYAKGQYPRGVDITLKLIEVID